MSLSKTVFTAWLTAASSFGCIVVEREHITAHDLAQASPAFAALDPQFAIAPAPFAGATRRMQVTELITLAKRHGLGTQNMPPDVCFERASELLSAERLQTALTKTFGEMTPVQILDFSRVRIAANSRIEFFPPYSSPLLRGRALSGDRSVALWVRIKPREGSGDVLATSDSIERGERVQVEVRSGGARLGFEANTASSGHTGDSVLVRNPENGRLFSAVVQGNKKVLVQR